MPSALDQDEGDIDETHAFTARFAFVDAHVERLFDGYEKASNMFAEHAKMMTKSIATLHDDA